MKYSDSALLAAFLNNKKEQWRTCKGWLKRHGVTVRGDETLKELQELIDRKLKECEQIQAQQPVD